ncbi:MAG: hypothetical protein R2788_14160 [Saprospiraceae bacterium]
MQPLTSIFSYLKKYRLYIIGNISSNILMVLFSIISIPAIIPFLNILLDQQQLVTDRPSASLNSQNVSEHVNYYFSQIINNQGKQTAIVYALMAIVILYFSKKLVSLFIPIFLAPVRNGIVRDLRQELYEKTLALPLAYYSEERKGDIFPYVGGCAREVG